MVTSPRRPERSIRCGVSHRDAAHLEVAVGRPGLGPAQEQRQPQPRRVGLDVEVEGRAGQGASLAERRLDVHDTDDRGAEHGRGCRREVAQPQDVRARFQGRRRRPGNLVLAGNERNRLARDHGGADAVAVHDLEGRASGLSARGRESRRPPVPLRGLIVANSRRSPTNDLAALRTLSWRRTLVDPRAPEPGGRRARRLRPASVRGMSVVSASSRDHGAGRNGGEHPRANDGSSRRCATTFTNLDGCA